MGEEAWKRLGEMETCSQVSQQLWIQRQVGWATWPGQVRCFPPVEANRASVTRPLQLLSSWLSGNFNQLSTRWITRYYGYYGYYGGKICTSAFGGHAALREEGWPVRRAPIVELATVTADINNKGGGTIWLWTLGLVEIPLKSIKVKSLTGSFGFWSEI